MTAITSYAQNFEDVMLWRALGHIQNGRYIDIGAQDPVVDSVSLAFHEHGWKGVHVEPTPHYAEMLRQQRPGDEIIQAAISTEAGVIKFFEIPQTGISTGDPTIAQQHRERGFDVREITVVSITLASIFKSCEEIEIHWLKIDVEGFEKQVLSSWSPSQVRPWVVVVESTLPLTQTESHETWEPILLGYGYTAVYFDGLNRYYISNVHPEIRSAFLSPPNVFDGFSVNGTASTTIHHLIEARHKEQVSKLVAQNEHQVLNNKNEISSLNQTLDQLSQELVAQKYSFELIQGEITNQLHTLQQQSAAEKSEFDLQHEADLRNLERQQAEASQQLHILHLQSATEKSEMVLQHQASLRNLERQQAEINQQSHILQLRSETEKSELALQLQASLRNLERQQAEAKQQLHALQLQSEAEKSELLRNHHAKLLDIAREQESYDRRNAERFSKLDQELQSMQADYSARERLHADRANTLKQELVSLLHNQAQREQEVTSQLLAIEQQAQQKISEHAQHNRDQAYELQREHSEQLCELQLVHDEQLRELQLEHIRREQAFELQLQSGRQELRRLDQERSHREKEQLEQYSLAKREIENCLRAQVQREKEIAVQIEDIQQKVEQEKADLVRNHSEEERALQHKFSEYEQFLNQKLDMAQEEIEQMKRTYSWRLTAPLRKLRPTASSHTTKCYKNSAIENLYLASKDYYVTRMPELIQLHIENEGNFKMRKSSQAAFKPNPDGIYHAHNFYRFYDSEFVSAAYMAILNRTPDIEGEQYYLKRIRSGISKENILIQMLKSSEAKQCGVRIQGLKAYAILEHILNIPFFGAGVALLFFSLTIKSHLRNLRALENYAYRVNFSVGLHPKNKDEAS
jgi:FkbM family methyltransferase